MAYFISSDKIINICNGLCRLANSGFFLNFLYQGGVKSTVSQVFEDLLSLKFQKATTYKENWSFPVSALLVVSAKRRQPTGQRQENFNFGCSLLKF